MLKFKQRSCTISSTTDMLWMLATNKWSVSILCVWIDLIPKDNELQMHIQSLLSKTFINIHPVIHGIFCSRISLADTNKKRYCFSVEGDKKCLQNPLCYDFSHQTMLDCQIKIIICFLRPRSFRKLSTTDKVMTVHNVST